MLINTQYRSEATEIMDDFDLRGATLEKALSSIARINQWLGGNSLTLNAVEQIIAQTGRKQLRILDLGCGNGDMLRKLDKLAQQKQYQFSMTGIDANLFTIETARTLSAGSAHITYTCTDFLEDGFKPEGYDIILFTLTLHHFTNEQIITLLRKCRLQAKLAIVINDLQRSRLSYFLFSLISTLFRLNPMNANDGKLSILRGFKRHELKALAQQLHVKQYSIRWKWAFRYQWIISDL